MCLAVAACTGTIDPESGEEGILLLKSDVREFYADGKSVVSFIVMLDDKDVTEDAVIKCVTDGVILSGNTFSTEKEGEYVFNASYNGVQSDNISVVALFSSSFERKVCVMEFTGQWCAQCPGGATILNFLVNDLYKGKVHALAFHNNDEYSLPVEQLLAERFKITTYPSYLTDMRDCGELNGNGCSDSIYKSLYESVTFCGPSVSCTFDQAAGTVAVSAKVVSEKTSEYRLAAYVVEDKVRGSQTLGTGSVQSDYNHRHIVRKMLSSDYMGDRLGTIAAGSEATKTYSFTLDPLWNPSNVSVVILAITSDGQVNNSASTNII